MRFRTLHIFSRSQPNGWAIIDDVVVGSWSMWVRHFSTLSPMVHRLFVIPCHCVCQPLPSLQSLFSRCKLGSAPLATTLAVLAFDASKTNHGFADMPTKACTAEGELPAPGAVVVPAPAIPHTRDPTEADQRGSQPVSLHPLTAKCRTPVKTCAPAPPPWKLAVMPADGAPPVINYAARLEPDGRMHRRYTYNLPTTVAPDDTS